MSINVDVKVIDDSNNQIETTFSENSTYDNSDNKFDLRKYEDNLVKNMSEKIFSELTLFIQTKINRDYKIISSIKFKRQ